MITVSDAVFPNNIMNLMKVRVPVAIDADMRIFLRPLRSTDPDQSIGISAGVWVPDKATQEMNASMQNLPTEQEYTVLIQSLVKHADEEAALNIHSVVASRIRSMLYTDSLLQLGFSQLSVASGGRTEQAMRWGPRTQRFISNEVSGTFIQSSITEFCLYTATR